MLAQLEHKHVLRELPIFLRLFKEDSEFEVLEIRIPAVALPCSRATYLSLVGELGQRGARRNREIGQR